MAKVFELDNKGRPIKERIKLSDLTAGIDDEARRMYLLVKCCFSDCNKNVEKTVKDVAQKTQNPLTLNLLNKTIAFTTRRQYQGLQDLLSSRYWYNRQLRKRKADEEDVLMYQLWALNTDELILKVLNVIKNSCWIKKDDLRAA